MEHYLDNSATTRMIDAAAQAAIRAMTQDFGNPSSQHKMGKTALDLLEKSRQSVGTAMNASAGNIIFTSCGTEAINTAILSAVYANRRVGKHIVSTKIEHKATLNTLKMLEQKGFKITLVSPQSDGEIHAEDVLEAMREDTALVTAMSVNSETGAILPTEQIAREMHKYAKSALIHVDAVQALLKIVFDATMYDYASVSGHKIGASKGVGALYFKNPKKLSPLIFGGGQEFEMRGGTQAMPQIASFGAACDARCEDFERDTDHMREILELLERELLKLPFAVKINSPQHRAPHILNISPTVGKSEVLVRILSDAGVYVSGGSACARGKKSDVLAAMHVSARDIDSALRVSVCPETTSEDILAFLAELQRAVAKFL